MVMHELVSVIVPVYDERSTVAEVIRQLRNVKMPTGWQHEVIVVDDGSRDGTARILATLSDPLVSVVTHDTNMGQGAAVRSGLAFSHGSVVVVLDADLEYDPADVARVIRPIVDGRAQVAFGTRFHPDHSVMPLSRLISARLLGTAAAVLYNSGLADASTGLRAFERSAIDAVSIRSNGFSWGFEVMAKLHRGGARFFEVAVSYDARRRGTKFTMSDRLAALGTLLRYRFARVSPITRPIRSNTGEGGTIIDLRRSARQRHNRAHR
jgi:glycosyltransferase involved in cell wall biosynthesis